MPDAAERLGMKRLTQLKAQAYINKMFRYLIDNIVNAPLLTVKVK